MITLPPVALTGAAQSVDLTVNDACCALIQNESAYALEVAIGPTKRWLGAWVADLFDVPPGVREIRWVPNLIGSLLNAPSTTLLITVAEPGEAFTGIYPIALTRQAGITAGNVKVPVQPPTPVVIENGAGTPLGDTSATALQADSITETITTTPAGGLSWGVIASLKAAAGQTIAQVGNAGAVALGTNTQVSPAFGQATVAGHCLAALVSCGTQDNPTTNAAGWVQAVAADRNSGNVPAIWVKLNCGNNEAAPVFTAPASVTQMFAQLAEFSGVATAAAIDQTGTFENGAATVTDTAAAADAAGGDLVLSCNRWQASSTATFSQSVNNGAALTHLGDTGGSSLQRHQSNNFAINPAAAPNLPLGVAPWPYDAFGTSAPAQGSQATVTLAASPGKKYIAAMLDASFTQGAAAATEDAVQLFDGLTEKHRHNLAVPTTQGAIGQYAHDGIAIPGTAGNAMSFKFSGGDANITQRVTIGAYLR